MKQQSRRPLVRAPAVCVATDREAAEAGTEVLSRGGNAFDAAVAAGFVEAVVSPNNSGIGGYGAAGVGFLAKAKAVVALDANAVAPSSATETLFPTVPARDPNGYTFPDARHKLGPLSVAVPGVLGGLLKTLETWGTRPRAEVMAPAIRLAREGVRLSAANAARWIALRAEADGTPIERPKSATQVVMTRLAETLEEIADEGASAFYAGRIGRAIADHVKAKGGILSREDMGRYEAVVVEPVSIGVDGRTFATPPPSSGGLTSLQIVALMDRLRGERVEAGSARAFERFLEVLKVAWEDRLTTLGDPAAMRRPPGAYLEGEHLDALLARVRAGLADPGPGRVVAPDPLRGTVHVAAADAEGNVAAWTQTHGGGFGAGVMVPGTEVVLGHGMCRFEPRPGWVNSVGPGKRPLHNMAPMVVVREGRAELAIGAAGGRTIVNNVAALAIGMVFDELDPEAALKAPRLHCETVEPAVVEESAGEGVIDELRRRGHQVKGAKRDAGVAHVIARDGEGWIAVAEPRSATAGAAG